jgi:NAD(P)-dependent dehydrogenase (short-subunit alcohol dehydrogenase family)
MDQPFSLRGRTALVTGASSGLGAHFAHVLAGQGAAVALAARRLDRLERLADDIRAAGGTAAPVACDVTDEASVAAAVAAAADALGPLDILVNNSGITGRKPFLETSGAEWDEVLQTNLRGAFLMCREFARAAVAAGRGGRIVNVASILGLRTIKGVVPYCTSKAGMVHMTAVLAMELGPQGITVNALAPGYVETDLNRDFLRGPAGARIAGRVPLGRIGAAEDLDGALLLLVSDAGRFITGVTLPVDGGHSVTSL